ncbi:LOW QUALITY PROTEIN: sorting nexin-10 [Zalophus californianus]|uniref:LOW QUALITY PROTEIN: sorting nexin-10 n=1 Tax=Zalophus californianus TaxID=9704 RepID=A0A6P9F187_ZALCA|nr:LOW QUALITY PROTEIN: sorting nexin-10 [Zalophus californianus]
MGSITSRSRGSRLKRHPGERVGRRWNPGCQKKWCGTLHQAGFGLIVSCAEDVSRTTERERDTARGNTSREFVSVWVRDPRIQKEDFWHSYIDYEICIHTNSMCFTMKTSCVRRRYREFVWLRQRLQSNALLVQLPELPSKNLFFNMNNRQHVDQRRQGLEDFLRKVLQNALLLSDSCLHLFLQSHLNSEDIEACVSGQTKYSVEDAIHKFALMNRRFPEEDEEGKKENDIDYDSESSSSGFGHSSDDSSSHGYKMSTTPQES